MTEKYAGKLEVVAVNISPTQDDQVVPFLAENRYTFTPYKVNAAIRRGYGVDGAPMEFVIDRSGHVVTMVRLNSEEREREFGHLVERLWNE